VRERRYQGGLPRRVMTFLLSALWGGIWFIATLAHAAPEPATPGQLPALAAKAAGYAAEASCLGCHDSQVAQWKGSDHAWAMRHATPDNVLGDSSRSSTPSAMIRCSNTWSPSPAAACKP